MSTGNEELVTFGPQIPPELLDNRLEGSDDDGDDVGPKPEQDKPAGPTVFGPQIPTDLLSRRRPPQDEGVHAHPVAGPSKPPARPPIGPSYPPPAYDKDASDSDDSDDIGPKPLPTGGIPSREMDGVMEFMEKEERRRRLIEEAAMPKALTRDEWMLVPPKSSDLLGSLDTTKLKPRQFAKSAAPAKNADSSLWTETPAERQQRIADEVSGKKRRAANADDSTTPEADAEVRRKRRRDEDIKRSVDAHTRQVRGTSLIDMHAKATTSSKEGEDGSGPPGIWDHSRDMALGGRLMDDGTRNKIVKDARTLGDKFGGGGFL